MLLKKEICKDIILDDITLEELNAVVWILTAYRKAKARHPKFSKGRIMYGQSIVLEEAGKLTRSVNKFLFENGGFDDLVLRAANTGAATLRLLMLLERKRKRAALIRKKPPVEYNPATDFQSLPITSKPLEK